MYLCMCLPAAFAHGNSLPLCLCLSLRGAKISSSDIHTHTQCRHLSEYLAEITIQEFAYLAFKPSQIAGSAVCLALHTLHLDTLPPLLRRVFASWGMDMDAVRACARYLSPLTHTRFLSVHTPRWAWACHSKTAGSRHDHYKWQLVDPHQDVPVSRDLHVTHTRIYHKQRTLQASFEKYSHNNRYEPRSFSATHPHSTCNDGG
jgi:hypothetical protein